MPRYGLKRLFLLILLPISLTFVILAPRFSPQIEQSYSLNIYNILSSAMASIFGLFPFSVAEILLVCAIGLFIGYTVYTIVKFKTDVSRRWYKLYTYCVNISVIAVCLFSFFVFACGLNYYRLPLTETSGLKVRKSMFTSLGRCAWTLPLPLTKAR